MIAVGDTLPWIATKTWNNGPADLNLAEQAAGKTLVVFGIPAAYTPTCSETHMPGFVMAQDQILAAGADGIYCMAVNDPFVLNAWLKAGNADKIIPLSDWSAQLTQALGLVQDMSGAGLGLRCRRFAMVLRDGKVTYFGVEDGPGQVTSSGADAVLAALSADN